MVAVERFPGGLGPTYISLFDAANGGRLIRRLNGDDPMPGDRHPRFSPDGTMV